MAKFTDLPIIYSNDSANNISDDHVFAVATNSTTDQLSLEELQKSFTGLRARTTDGISIIGKTTPSGITVGDNGFIGLNNNNPSYILDVHDNVAGTEPQVRITAGQTSRKASYTLADSEIFWKSTKRASDKDFYLEVSEDDSNYTGVLNVSKDGNVGIFNGASTLTDKFYVSGGSSKFESGNYEIVIDPSNLEIKSNVFGDTLYLNSTNTNNVILGNNVVYVKNSASNRYVGINTTGPTSFLHVDGGSQANLAKFTTTNSLCNINLKNSSSTVSGYIGMSGQILNFGPNVGGSGNILFLNNSTQKAGVGTDSPTSKFHVYSADENILKIESDQNAYCEVFKVNNYSTGPTAPIHSIYTFARREDSTGPNTAKWGIGLYNKTSVSSTSYVDNFVFRVDSDTTDDSAIRARLTRDGSLDIKGSYTTSGNYSKGKFVQMYQTRLTGDCLYFNPFYPDSNTNPSGHNNFHAPFCVAPYSGKIEKIQVFSSDQDMAFSTTNGGRFEISVITPSNDANANNFVSGFYLSPTSPATTLPVSGIVSQFSLTSAANTNQVYTYSTFSGSPTFTAGQILQYRITDADQRSSYAPAFTVVSTISYNVT